MSLGSRWSLVVVSLSLLVMSLPGLAQTASLVKDVNTVPYTPYDSSPSGFTELHGAVYFSASAAPGEYGLWRTDGTAPGTQLVKDGLIIDELFVSGGVLYMVADDGVRGIELWKSDGTEAGTGLVKDINPGRGNGLRFGLAELNGTLYFAADDGAGFELWRSDGTSAGTVMVKDINGGEPSFPVSLTVVSDTLFFAAQDETSGNELWKSDGTTAGTVLVKDINPGSEWSLPGSMVNANDLLLFRADDGVNGRELWRSDGTPGGTVMVRDLNPGAASSSLNLFDASLYAFDGQAFFGANTGAGFSLWKTDGTMAGTKMIQGGLLPAAFHAVGTTLYFLEEGETPLSASRLWRTDGTPAGTQLVKESEGNIGRRLASTGEMLFFTAGATVFDHDLWRSDGSANGTVLVENLGGGANAQITGIGETLFLTGQTDETGLELWTSDGTAIGTGLLKDIGIAPGGSIANNIIPANDSISPFATALGRLFFAANDGVHGIELWKTDGTEQGTTMVKDINPSEFLGVYSDEMINFGGQVLFSADDGVHGYELWRSDGSENGTAMVKDIHSRPGESGFPTGLTELNGVLYFAASSHANGDELWRSDGTSAGTVLVKDITPGVLGSFPNSLRVAGDRLFFIADDGINGQALWRSDGTAAGTVMVKDVHPVNQEDFYFELVSSGNLIYFRADAGDGHKLWRSNGTAAGTIPIRSLTTAASIFTSALLTDVDGTLFFFDDDELWKSDGTAQGTTLVKDLNFLPVPRSSPDTTTSSDGLLYFMAAANQLALWRSDGTEAGTVAIKQFDLAPSNRATTRAQIIGQAGGALFLSVTSEDGSQLWRSHGTNETTVAVPNVFITAVGPLASMGSNVFFAAETKETGRELWTAPLLPAIRSGGVVDAAGFRPTLAPGSLASLFGVELSTTTVAAETLPLPTLLAGARIQVNGIDAPLLFVSPKQINFQVPFETPEGDVSVVAILGDQQGPGEPATVAEFAPGLFVNPATGSPIIQRHPDGTLITAQNPAKPGDILILYVTGIGGLDNPPANGAPASDSPLSTATVTPTVTVGGVEVIVSFAGLAPDFVGLGQINIELPAGLSEGSPLPLVVRFGDNDSQTVQLPF